MRHILLSLLLLCGLPLWAQQSDEQERFIDNWYLQTGADITLQKPYSYPTSDMLSKGSSLGVDMAIGRSFTPEFGVRALVNWENGLLDTRSPWLAPFNEPGVNHDRGGYLCLVGDLLLDVHNIIAGYNPQRRWNTQLIVRGGGVYNWGTNKGAPLIGAGIGNTYRLSNNCGLYLDVVYNGVSSGFTMDPSTATGTGSGQNMFFDFNLGFQYYLGGTHYRGAAATPNSLSDRTFWRHWFVQFGTDMTLYNPVEKDFSDVLSQGRSMGIDIAVGKWFSPMVGLRGKLNWENGLLHSDNFQWVGYDKSRHSSNHDGGGSLLITLDGFLSLKHMLIPYAQGERWNSYVIPRMGLSRNISTASLSPVVGVGFGGSYSISRRLGLYAETVYQGTTSEFFSGVSWSGPTGSKFNGIWDFNAGIQINL